MGTGCKLHLCRIYAICSLLYEEIGNYCHYFLLHSDAVHGKVCNKLRNLPQCLTLFRKKDNNEEKAI